jgi:uncharacterized protein (TIGR02145 family)
VKHLCLFGLLLSLSIVGYSQGEFNNWYFGSRAGVGFNSGVPVPLLDCSIFGTEAESCISDSSGNLLFYGNNLNVINRNHQIMPNGSPLLGGGLMRMQYIFSVQKLNDDSSYLVFTVGSMNPFMFTDGLRYSNLDMRLAGGFGDITPGQKNLVVPGATDASGALTGIRHHNNRDVWIVVRKWSSSGSQLFASYLITSSGLNTTPVYSNSSFMLPFYNGPGNVIDYIKISPDGQKLVCIYDTTFEYCSFNSVTGAITSIFVNTLPRINNLPTYLATAEFSGKSNLIYLAGYIGNSHYLYQFDALKTDTASFNSSRILLDCNFPQSLGLQRGSDDKIYISNSNKDSLSVIQFPNIPGIGCQFTRNLFSLAGRYCDLNLPQFLQKYKAYIHYSSLCQNDSIQFYGDIWPPPDSIRWDFGDPGSGLNNYSNLDTTTHIYTSTGTYTVELFVRHNDNRTDTSWRTITIVANPSVVLGPDKIVCIGDSATFDAGICSGCTYLWKDLGSGLTVGTSQTFKTGLAGHYSVTVTNSNGCAGRDTVQLFTTAVPSLTNNPLNDSICSGETTNIPLTSNPTGASFHWTATLTSGTITGFSADSGLVINQTLLNTGITTGILTYHITPKIGNCAGNTMDFPVTVSLGDSVKVSITASGNNVCAGTSVTYNAFPVNPGLTPVYHWKVNGINSGINSSTFSYTPVNTDVVTCELTSSLTVCISNNPATSNGITMTVNPNLAVSVTVTPTQNPVCSGTSVNFTAHPINEGTVPTYLWKVNGNPVGANLPTYTYIPLSGDGVTCTVNSNATCAVNNPTTSPVVTMTVNPNLLVTVSIISSSNPFCAGSSVTFTATPNNGGTPPSYQWKVNGIGVGPDNQVYSYFPNNGDVVTCVLNSNIACPVGNPATSNAITMVVNSNLPAGVSITATPNPFCPGSSVTFHATPSNGGPLPAYQWKVNGINAGVNSDTYSYSPANGDSVRCVMTSNLACVNGNPASSSKIILSGTLAPNVSFTSCYDTITTISAKPIKLKGGIPLGGTYSGAGVNSITGVYTPSAAGAGIHAITYTYTNASACSANRSRNINVLSPPPFTCGNNLTDIRDNKSYPTVQIGSQCWLASNLNFGSILASSQDQRDNCIAEKYCYNDNPVNCTNHGGLYQWDEVMRFDETPADQGFCPPGWHIPSENDWNVLFAVYLNSGFAGSPLKYSGYSGFNALLSGARHINRGWDFNGFATFFWSSASRSDNKAWAHGMNEVDPSVSLYPSSRVNAFSVRCLKD